MVGIFRIKSSSSAEARASAQLGDTVLKNQSIMREIYSTQTEI